jgi:hypothetical protein
MRIDVAYLQAQGINFVVLRRGRQDGKRQRSPGAAQQPRPAGAP